MANLKDIGYGVGKYLEASDASGIPDIGTNRTNLDLLNFKVATNNAYALYNFKDGMIDAYQTEAGVDTGTSTNETYDAAGDYYSGQVAGSATYSVFTTTPGGGTWTVPAGVTSVEALVVAGGGAGGNGYAGGGGAGGIVHHTSFAVTPGADVTVTVGAGGAAGNTSAAANKGSDSVFSTMTATGGGGGGTSVAASSSGGSGGGGGMIDGTDGTGGAAGQPAVSGATVYANAGGNGEGAPDYTAGGGGGAAAAGSNSSGNAAGPGGAGKQFSNFTSYGESSGYFGGGGGGSYNSAYATSAGTGGIGGGGNGRELSAGNGYNATANTGSGGGGGGRYWAPVTYSGAGGSGFVGLLYTPNVVNNMTLVSNAQTAQAAPTEGRLMIYEETSTGSTTLDTDLKGYVSRDGGTTYTQTPLTLDTTYETGKTLVSGSVDISGQPSGTNMKYKIETLNQSGSKVCRLHGASLLWA